MVTKSQFSQKHWLVLAGEQLEMGKQGLFLLSTKGDQEWIYY
jgi:hypothetical protein